MVHAIACILRYTVASACSIQATSQHSIQTSSCLITENTRQLEICGTVAEPVDRADRSLYKIGSSPVARRTA